MGAGKAGTTSLYQYLKQHPEVYMSPVKEPKFFAFEGWKPDFQARFLPRSPETLLRVVRDGEDRGVPLRGFEQGRGRRFANHLPPPRGGRRFRAGYLAAAQCLWHPQEPGSARVGQETERREVLPEAAPARKDTQAALGKRAELEPQEGSAATRGGAEGARADGPLGHPRAARPHRTRPLRLARRARSNRKIAYAPPRRKSGPEPPRAN